MSFTDQQRRVATAEDVARKWGLRPRGEGFHCYLCGKNFGVGDGWRWVYALGRTFTSPTGTVYGVTNFLVGDCCDGPDALDRWVALNRDFHSPRFKALRWVAQ